MRITARQYALAWYSALKNAPKSEWGAISDAVIRTIHKQGKMKLFRDIIHGVERLDDTQTGTTAVTVRLAHNTDDATVNALVEHFLPSIKSRVSTTIDTSLIGGAQIQTENSRWDASVRGQLRSLEKTINA